MARYRCKYRRLFGRILTTGCVFLVSPVINSVELITGELPPYFSATMEHGGELTYDITKVIKTFNVEDIALSYQS